MEVQPSRVTSILSGTNNFTIDTLVRAGRAGVVRPRAVLGRWTWPGPNVVLHATRENSPVSEAVDRQFQLRSSPLRPVICEVTVAELWAFAQSWGEKRRLILKQVIDDLVILPISNTRIHK